MVHMDMTEKIRIPVITDTVMVDGHYQEERRSGEDRRKIERSGLVTSAESIPTLVDLPTSQ